MKRYIKKKLYDTEKAKFCGSWSNGLPEDNPKWLSESLYLRKNGDYFLHSRGGDRSRCAIGEDRELLELLTYDAAKEWGQEHLSQEQYDDVFGIFSDDTTKTERLFLTVDAPAAKILKQEASKRGVTLSVLISSLAWEMREKNLDPRGV